jgi:hypothetical protein
LLPAHRCFPLLCTCLSSLAAHPTNCRRGRGRCDPNPKLRPLKACASLPRASMNVAAFRSQGVAFTGTRIFVASFSCSTPASVFHPPLPRRTSHHTTWGLRSKLHSLAPLIPTPPSCRRSWATKHVTTTISVSFRRHCSHHSLQARSISVATGNMADRDILPDSFKPVHYDLIIKDLDFKTWTYNGTVRLYLSPKWCNGSANEGTGLTARWSSPQARLS